MKDITRQKYWSEIDSIAAEIAAEAMEAAEGDREAADESIFDWRLNNWIDGHEWIIYPHGNDAVMAHTDNPDAYQVCYSNADLGALVAEKGIEGAKAAMAFFAMYQDVSDLIRDKLDELEGE